jgi:hypothetical protein
MLYRGVMKLVRRVRHGKAAAPAQPSPQTGD